MSANDVISINDRYQELLQQRIELECKVAQSILARNAEDETKLRILNKKISDLEKILYSANTTMSANIDELYPEHASYSSKIHS